MIIDDRRFDKKELSWGELEAKGVYVSHRLQKYVMKTDDAYVVCLETAELFDRDECLGDLFEPVRATLVVE